MDDQRFDVVVFWAIAGTVEDVVGESLTRKQADMLCWKAFQNTDNRFAAKVVQAGSLKVGDTAMKFLA